MTFVFTKRAVAVGGGGGCQDTSWTRFAHASEQPTQGWTHAAWNLWWGLKHSCMAGHHVILLFSSVPGEIGEDGLGFLDHRLLYLLFLHGKNILSDFNVFLSVIWSRGSGWRGDVALLCNRSMTLCILFFLRVCFLILFAYYLLPFGHQNMESWSSIIHVSSLLGQTLCISSASCQGIFFPVVKMDLAIKKSQSNITHCFNFLMIMRLFNSI